MGDGTHSPRAHAMNVGRGSRALALAAVLMLVVVPALSMLPEAGSAASLGDETPVATGTADQNRPAIDGNTVVWEDSRNGHYDIYMYDLASATETRVTTDTAHSYAASVSGSRIVWTDTRNGQYDVYLYDIYTHTESRITYAASNHRGGAISGSRIVWYDDTSGNYDVYMYDLDTHTQTRVTTDASHQYVPAICGDRIVYQDSRNGNYDIYMYDLATGTETRITTDTRAQFSPAIDGSRIVWQDSRNGNDDIYMYDVDTRTETRITTSTAKQTDPKISGSRIVWADDRNSNWDIYMYDLDTATETQVTTNMLAQYLPVISGRMIAWGDQRSGNADIYARKVWKSFEPPRWAALPTFHATEDVPIETNLAGYCIDPDTPLEGLYLNHVSQYVIAVDGLKVTFLFTEEMTHASVPVILSDEDQEALADINFTIDLRNDPPTCTVPTEHTVAEDEPYTIDFGPHVTDPDSPRDALGLSTDSLYATVQGLNLTLTYPEDVLTDVVWVNVTDGLASTQVRLGINVTLTDDPPVVLPIPVFVAVEDVESVLDLAPYLRDEDTPIDQLRVLARDRNCTVVGLELHFLFLSPVGETNVTIEVVDAHSRVTATVRVTVQAVDDPPILGEVPLQTVKEDSTARIDLTHYVLDEDTPKEDLTIECAAPHAVGVEGLVLLLRYDRWQPDHTVEFSVTDGTSHAHGILTVRVEEVNDPPVILGFGDRDPPVVMEMREGEVRWVEVRVSDEDSTAFEYSVRSAWRGIAALPNGTLRLEAVQADVGTNYANVTVDDLAGGTDTLEIAVTVVNVDDPPSAPVIVVPTNHTAVEEGSNVTFRVDVFDPDMMLGQVLTVTWTSNVSGTLMTLTSDQPLAFVTDALPVGVHRITVTVTDGTHEAAAWFELTVTAKPVPPSDRTPFLSTPAGVAAILVAIALVVVVALLGAKMARRASAGRREDEERARAGAERRARAEAEGRGLVMGGDLAQLSRDLGASADRLEAQRAAEAAVAAPAAPPPPVAPVAPAVAPTAPAEAPAPPAAVPAALTPEDEADRERTLELRELRRMLTQMPQGLPTSLSGMDNNELARTFLDGERRTAPDGTRLVLIRGRWYCANRHDVRNFAQEWREPEPAIAPARPTAPAEMDMEERIERLETALLEGKISEATYKDLKRKYEGG